MSRVPPRHPDLVYPSDYHTDDDDGPFFICLVVAVVIAIVVIIIVVPFVNNDHSQPTDDVIQDMDDYGATIYLNESTGSGALSLASQYVPKEAIVRDAGDYIYVLGAKNYAYETNTKEIYIPKQSIEYIVLNNH